MNANFPNESTDFGLWCKTQYYSGGIHVIDNGPDDAQELVIPDSTLDAGFRWLASRCDPKSGESCIDFMLDEIIDEATDKYAAKMLVCALTETDPLVVAEAAREIRRHYTRRKIEYFADVLFALDSQGPDPMTTRKDQIESDMSNTRAA